jgi:hypothetical protein
VARASNTFGTIDPFDAGLHDGAEVSGRLADPTQSCRLRSSRPAATLGPFTAAYPFGNPQCSYCFILTEAEIVHT